MSKINEFEEQEDISVDEEILEANNEIEKDIDRYNPSSIVVYSRDWTIETINNQIEQGNIDLNPEFQRRNAWTDEKRSKLIESIIIGYPVPEIVLAEDPSRKRSFIVIDGKQRLLTIAGFINNTKYKYWDKDRLSELLVREDLNNIYYRNLASDMKFSEEFREFNNASLRCTIITNFNKNDVLYDIFYRLNSGSVPLSTQELRQVIYRGDFSNFLITVTDTLQPIHSVLKLKGPDKRLRDVEILLRLISMIFFPKKYSGNLKKFLDDSMFSLNNDWIKYSKDITGAYNNINTAIRVLIDIFGDAKILGRKFEKVKYETKYNRVLLEVEIYYFYYLVINLDNDSIISMKDDFIDNFKQLSMRPEFKSSIESTTKSIENYKIRFELFGKLILDVFNTKIENPFI